MSRTPPTSTADAPQATSLCESCPFSGREPNVQGGVPYDGWDAFLAVTHFDEQLRLASQVQQEMLPNPLPTSPTVKFHALYLPADHVSGDIYDIVRLDETNLAISLADATGHGIPAALLTVFIRRTFRGKEIENGTYRILEPDEVLRRMNRELMESRLSHCQFVTSSHAIYDEKTRVIRWARGGLPYPVMVPADGPPAFARSMGVLLGAIEEPPFDIAQKRLKKGDRLYFYTDGLEALLCQRRAGENPFDISYTPWFKSLAHRDPQDALQEIAQLRRHISPSSWPFDDISIVCVECIA